MASPTHSSSPPGCTNTPFPAHFDAPSDDSGSGVCQRWIWMLPLASDSPMWTGSATRQPQGLGVVQMTWPDRRVIRRPGKLPIFAMPTTRSRNLALNCAWDNLKTLGRVASKPRARALNNTGYDGMYVCQYRRRSIDGEGRSIGNLQDLHAIKMF